jgi:ribosomal protein L16 Arg81 hydroxylase
MSFRRLLAESDIPSFLENYFQRLPYSKSVASAECLAYGTWETLTKVIASPDADVMVVRQNQQYAGPLPVTTEEAQALVADGYTLLVRHAERHDPALEEFARGLAADFAAPINIHIYCTPASEVGFAWHYDAEEVFIVQTTGVKEYFLRKNSVNPWPIEETLPRDMRYEREIMPLMKVVLAAGDWLYIPSGYWHYGAAHEAAISLSIGVAPRTGVDLFDALRKRVVDSLLWRQRLPVMGTIAAATDEELREQLANILRQLNHDLTRMIADPKLLLDFLREMRQG